MTPPTDELFDLIERSPACVAAHDRQAWLDLFAEHAVVEDPVGSPAVQKGDGTLARFWDTFIGPHQTRFEVLADYAQGDDVLRDVVIHTEIRPGVNVQVPAYLLYQSEVRDGRRRLGRLAAHWTLRHSGHQVRRMGARAWLPMTALWVRMLRRMGPRWVRSYMASQWTGVGLRGVRGAEALARAISAGDEAALRALFVSDGAEVSLGDVRTTPAALLAQLPAGSQLVIEAPIAAGWVTGRRFRIEGPAPAQGLALLETAPETQQLRRARFFTAAR